MRERSAARAPRNAGRVRVERVRRALEVEHVVVAMLVDQERVDLPGGDHGAVIRTPCDGQLRPQGPQPALPHDVRGLPRRPLCELAPQLRRRRDGHAVEVELDGPVQLRAQTAGELAALAPAVADAGGGLGVAISVSIS